MSLAISGALLRGLAAELATTTTPEHLLGRWEWDRALTQARTLVAWKEAKDSSLGSDPTPAQLEERVTQVLSQLDPRQASLEFREGGLVSMTARSQTASLHLGKFNGGYLLSPLPTLDPSKSFGLRSVPGLSNAMEMVFELGEPGTRSRVLARMVYLKASQAGASIRTIESRIALKGHAGRVTGAFSADGSLLATGADDEVIRIWQRQEAGFALSLAITNSLGVGGDSGFSRVGCLLFQDAPGGLVGGAMNGRVSTWLRSKDGSLQTSRTSSSNDWGGPILALHPLPQERRVFIASESAACVVEVRAGPWPQLARQELNPKVNCAAASASGRWAAAGSWIINRRPGDWFVLWRIEPSGALHQVLAVSNTIPVVAMAFSPDGQWLALSRSGTAGSKYQQLDGSQKSLTEPASELEIWQVASSGQLQIKSSTPLSTRSYSVAFAPDGRRIAAGGYGNTARLWQLKPDGTLHEAAALTAQTEWVYSVQFSPDGEWLMGGATDGTGRLWNIGR